MAATFRLRRERRQQCLEEGLLDEISRPVAPVLVSDGVRLFERTGGDPVKSRSDLVCRRGRDRAPLLDRTRASR
jgi:hypothetical protein